MDTQRKQILQWLTKGKSLTVLVAIEQFGCYALSQRIGELVRDGYHITRDRAEINGKRVGMYYIKHADIARAKAMRKERGE